MYTFKGSLQTDPCSFILSLELLPALLWERGTNENINGLIRDYLPKGTDFSTITTHQLKFIEKRLNHRPRKCLGFKTPNKSYFLRCTSQLNVKIKYFL